LSSSGRPTSLRLHRRLHQLRRRVRQVARPSSGSVVVLVRSPDLPYGFVVTFAFTSSENLLSDFARILLASSIYKNAALRSGGRSHAHGMASQLLCGFIAQQCSTLASPNLTVLFIADAAPRAACEVMTLSPRDEWTYSLRIIKGEDVTFPDSRCLRRLCINDD
jgi:hypothetical protein